jgi:hypothetical protein
MRHHVQSIIKHETRPGSTRQHLRRTGRSVLRVEVIVRTEECAAERLIHIKDTPTRAIRLRRVLLNIVPIIAIYYYSTRCIFFTDSELEI